MLIRRFVAIGRESDFGRDLALASGSRLFPTVSEARAIETLHSIVRRDVSFIERHRTTIRWLLLQVRKAPDAELVSPSMERYEVCYPTGRNLYLGSVSALSSYNGPAAGALYIRGSRN